MRRLMRPLAISSLLVVMLAGLAVTPMASAAPPQPACNGTWAVTETAGPVTVFASPPCYEVSIRTMSCPLSPDQWTEARVGQVAVRVQTCGPVEGESSAAAAPPCTCPPPPRCNQIWTEGPLASIVSVTVTSDCRIIVAVLHGTIACADPLDGTTVVTLGRVAVVLPCGEITACEPPLECYPTATASAAPPPIVCGPTAMCTEPQLSICDNPDMCNDAGCPYPVGADQGTTVSAGGLTVHHACGGQELCSGPLRCTSPFDSMASSSAVLVPPVCIRKDVTQGPVHANVGQCDPQQVDVDLCPGTWGSPQRVEHTENVRDLAILHAEACMPHSPPPTATAAALELPNPCGETAYCTGPSCPAQSVGSNVDHENSVTLTEDCAVVVVTGKGQICVGAWSGHDVHQVGPITWDRYYCKFPGGNPVELSSAASTGPCGAANPQQRCPAPVPLCSGIDDEALAPAGGPVSVSYDLHANCHVDVFVKAAVMDCPAGEGYDPSTYGPVTVWVQGCRPPPVASTAMADPFPTCIRECPPIPNEGCELQEATPTTVGPLLLPFNPQAFVWGGDCDVDVEPIGACAPPSGKMVERRVGPIHLKVLLCGGDLPDWS